MFSQKHSISLDGQSHTHIVRFDFLSFADNGRNVWDLYIYTHTYNQLILQFPLLWKAHAVMSALVRFLQDEK